MGELSYYLLYRINNYNLICLNNLYIVHNILDEIWRNIWSSYVVLDEFTNIFFLIEDLVASRIGVFFIEKVLLSVCSKCVVKIEIDACSYLIHVFKIWHGFV